MSSNLTRPTMKDDRIKVRSEEIGRCKFCHQYQIDPKIHEDQFVCDKCWKAKGLDKK